MAHGSDVLRWLYTTWRARSRARNAEPTTPATDPEAAAWHSARRSAQRARGRAIAAGSGAAGTAAVVLATVPAAPVAGGGLVLAAGLLGVGLKAAHRSRRLKPATEAPPAPLPSPGSPGYRYLTRLDAAVLALERMLGHAEYGAGLDRADAAGIRATARTAAAEVREVARRLTAAEEAHRRLMDPQSRIVIDRTISTLTADLHDGVTGVERLVAAASEVVIAASGSGLTGSTANYLLKAAVGDLEARAAGLRASQRALDDGPLELPPRDS